VALEQQMTRLQANSERFSFQEELAFGASGATGGLLGQSVPFVLIVAGDGEASDSPPQVTAVSELVGLHEEQTRTIGDTIYRYRRQAAEIDGGRPWVRSQRPAKEETSGPDPGGILESDQAGQQGTFSKLVEELNGALAIAESGPVTVDDQRVTEFDATLDPAPFLAQLKSHSKEPEHPLSSPFESLPVRNPKAPATPVAPPTLELEAFIAPNGLPVRARFTFTDAGATIAVRVDTLAINVPVHVTPPPARETVDEKQLEQIERRRAARKLKQALRACGRLHGNRAAQCRKLAKLNSKVVSSESLP
jgi:hypothetical protein